MTILKFSAFIFQRFLSETTSSGNNLIFQLYIQENIIFFYFNKHRKKDEIKKSILLGLDIWLNGILTFDGYFMRNLVLG